MTLKLLLIALGGALGTLARFGTSLLLTQWIQRHHYPYATLAVNLLGCFGIGLVHGLFLGRWNVSETARFAIIVGFLGGYTTFSAFAWESTVLLREANYNRAFAHLALNNFAGLALVLAGYALGRR
jgi:CrcB protein